MTTEDILTLAKAGFTAQQIAALSTVSNATPNEPEKQIAEEPAAPVAKETATEKPETPKPVDPVLEAVNRLTGLVQAKAIGATQQPEHVETPEEILANIIAPKPKIKGE
jgi:hypothetical protein